MLDHDDLKWVATNLTELNRQLQQVSRYSDQARQQTDNRQYLELLGDEVEHASKISQALFDRITSRILSATANGRSPASPTPHLQIMPAPARPAAATIAKKIPVGEVAMDSVKSEVPAIRNPNGERELILLVDDDAEVLEQAAKMLEAQDYKVILAKDGLEALQIYGRMGKEISLIILDFFLPVMDGDAVFDELKALDPGVQVVLSSGFAEQTKLGSMLARGLCGFIPKPYTSQKLLDQVHSIIAA
jgi:CheY-like chemotaxis protein